jgi:hypothetical protein
MPILNVVFIYTCIEVSPGEHLSPKVGEPAACPAHVRYWLTIVPLMLFLQRTATYRKIEPVSP